MALRVLVCIKRVPAPGARIVLTPDRRAIDTRSLGFTISPHEECAVEEALRLTERHGGEVTVLTLGPAEAGEQLRYALSLGVHRAVHLTSDELSDEHDWDPQATARSIADAIGALESDGGPFDIVLFGNESADAGGHQVGVRVARSLGRAIVNGIKAIDVEAGTATLRRDAGAAFEVYRLALPAVVGVREGINVPRYPTVPGRLRSKKAEIPGVPAVATAGGLVTLGFENVPEVAVDTVVLGHGPDAAPAVVDLIERLGLL